MISVIIPAYNSTRTLPACLKALMHQTKAPDEIIVVDDGSSDGTVEFARQAGVRVIQQVHQGPAAARNLGVQQAHGDLILFTDSDCEPDGGWVERMSAPFHDPAVVGAKGVYRTRQPDLAPRFVQQEYESKYVRMARQPNIDFIDTYSAAYRRDIFLENEGFDPAFPAPSVEDQEFSFRLARKGYRLVYAPQAIVYHQHDSDLSEYFRRKYFIGYWKAFMLRWLPEKTFNDSHTLPSQRWQILLLGLVVASLGLSLFWKPGLWLALAWFIFFYASAFSFLTQIWKKDRPVLWAAPGLLLCRALALGMGLTVGFLFPPKTHRRVSAGLILGQRAFKRLLDIVATLVGLVIAFPILVVAGVAIKITSPGPIFFFQPRCGENGRPFKIVKLRTMVVGAEQKLEQVMKQNQLKGPAFKIPDDPRVTRVGRFLRRWSLDELPQLWNVLRGEMSLVGPRPEETWVVAQYNDHQRQRLLLKPGLTGPMQVYGRGDLDLDARLALELDYIQHYSLWKDVQILLRTIPAIISGEGAY
jgi:lipopolysaccharide/colanic/teichoic acid biosynthesis glycosyltransferase/GT2 family glycosyltransferase